LRFSLIQARGDKERFLSFDFRTVARAFGHLYQTEKLWPPSHPAADRHWIEVPTTLLARADDVIE
jgi:hypothetical protein